MRFGYSMTCTCINTIQTHKKNINSTWIEFQSIYEYKETYK